MKNLKVFLCAMLLVLGITTIAGAAPHWVSGVGAGSGWYDVNKADVYGADSLMCWAASASNVLTYTQWYGWDSGTSSLLNTPAQIYGTFTGNWANGVGAPFYGYEWWFTNRAVSIVNAAKTLDGGGLNFYPGVPIDIPANQPNTVTFWSDSANAAIPFYIDDPTVARGISLSITVNNPGGGGTFGHSLTLWGYDPDNNLLWVTDSDDGGAAQLDQYSYTVDAGNVWRIVGYSNIYTNSTDVVIDQVTRLNFNTGGIEPDHGGGNGNGNGGEVPEPATLLLVGSGVLGLSSLRKRIGKNRKRI